MGFIKLVAAFLLINAVLVYSENEFRNYRLVRIVPKSQEQIELVGSWQHNVDFDVWNVKQAHIDVALSPKAFESYSAILNENSIQYEILNNDIQRNIDEEQRSLKLKALSGDSKVVNTYASHTAINSWLDLTAGLYSHVSTYSSGNTTEGRDLKVIRINKPGTQRKIWIDCGIHAREWISPTTCTYIIDQLTRNYDSIPDVKTVVDYYDFHILPVHNPDGYDFSRSSTANRLWRKNRKVNSGSTCIGVDLNRNFGFQWMVAGASNNPCSDTYAGPTPDSELETKAVETVINQYKGQWDAFFTIHTYGQYWFTPWGYTSALPSDYNELVAKINIGAAAIKAVNGLTFKVGSSTVLLYAAAGGSDDWAKGVAGVKYSHCLELRPGDTGADASYGFQLPVDRAPLAGEETFRGILAFLRSFIKP